MSYTPVPTVNTNDLWTAANHNTYVKDNFAAGVPDIFTTKGDLAVATGADAATRLAAGSDGSILTALASQSTGLYWNSLAGITFPARAYLSSVQNINNNSLTQVAFDAESYDVGTCFTTGASAKYTASIGGYFQVHVAATFLIPGMDAGETCYIEIYKNNAQYSIPCKFISPGTYTYASITVNGSDIVPLVVNDYIDMRVFQNSGAAVNISSGGIATYISVVRVG